MNRAQRRKLAASLRQGLAEGRATPWSGDDRAWFAAHPRHAHRVRGAFAGEYQIEPEPDFVVIRQLRPGLRLRKPFTLVACSPDLVGIMQDLARRGLDDNEGAAHALFDLPGDRTIQRDELMAIIAAHESGSAMH
jgi:hypothetical protein